MPANVRLVLIVRDRGLRSTLAARLTLRGALVDTADNFHDPALHRVDPAGALLVLDRDAMGAGPDIWSEALQDEARWSRLAILTGEDPMPVSDDPRLVFIRKHDAVEQLTQLIAATS